jgi:hypothetical protein
VARALGGVIGLAFAVLLYLILAHVLGLVLITGPLSTFLAALGLATGAWIVIAVFAIAITTLFAYTIGAVATLPLMAPPITAAPLAADPIEAFMGGFITGTTAGVNFGVWALLPFGWAGVVIGSVVGLICFLSLFAPLSRSLIFQAVLGWTCWIMPFSYLATALGFVLFIVNLPFALAMFGPGALRFDVLTATVETTGGLVGITGFTGGGFSLGNFSFLSPTPLVGLGIQTPFGAPGLSAHETGHTLTIAGFGGAFHWINAVDENVPPLRRGPAAYGELITESHFPRGLPFRHILIWS